MSPPISGPSTLTSTIVASSSSSFYFDLAAPHQRHRALSSQIVTPGRPAAYSLNRKHKLSCQISNTDTMDLIEVSTFDTFLQKQAATILKIDAQNYVNLHQNHKIKLKFKILRNCPKQIMINRYMFNSRYLIDITRLSMPQLLYSEITRVSSLIISSFYLLERYKQGDTGVSLTQGKMTEAELRVADETS